MGATGGRGGAASYLASSCNSDGKFNYLARANGLSHPERDKYDVTQHAWVVSALAQYALYEKSGADTHVAHKTDDVPVDVEHALLRGAQYLVAHIRPPVETSAVAVSQVFAPRCCRSRPFAP